jgi:hypothetical protein
MSKAASSSSARSRAAARESQEAAEQDQVLPAGELLVDRRELAGEADQLPDRVGLRHDVVPEDRRAPGVGGDQGGEHPDRGGLARAVGAEHAVDGAGRPREVDTVDGAGVAERLPQPAGLDGQRRPCGHRSPHLGLLASIPEGCDKTRAAQSSDATDFPVPAGHAAGRHIGHSGGPPGAAIGAAATKPCRS